MTDAFHRLVAPAYFTGGGTFPTESGTTYDYINNGGSGTPALADSAKVGGPNAGTLFSAFGEDATASNFNRSNQALSQNCDHLDNLLHRSLATVIRTSDTTPGSPVSTIVLPAGTFLGTVGYTTSVADLKRLFHVTDTSDNDITLASNGTLVNVTSVTLSTGDVIGGAGANGSFSGNTITLNLATPIPASQAYRVYYSTRTNLATMPLDGFMNIIIRGAEEVSGTVEGLFRTLHGNSEAWNASWDSTIFDLVNGGLNARYRRSTDADGAAPETYFVSSTNDPGAGAWINRDGPALTVYAADGGSYVDPLNALIAGKFFDSDPSSSGGAVGVAVYGARQSATALTGETVSHTPGAYSFMHLWPHYFQSSIHATHPRTRIVDGATATIGNHGSYNVDTGELIVTVTQAGNYFRDGTGTSSIALGHDLLQLQYVVSSVTLTHYVVIVAHGETGDTTNVTKVRVRNLDGTVPNLAGVSSLTIRWVSVTMSVGDGAGTFHARTHTDVAPVLGDSFYFQIPPYLTNDSEDNVTRDSPTFGAPDTSNVVPALQWGGFQYTNPSGFVVSGALNGDGSIGCAGIVNCGSVQTNSGSVLVHGGDVIAFSGSVGSNSASVKPQLLGTSGAVSTSNVAWDVSLGGIARITSTTLSSGQIIITNIPRDGTTIKLILTRSGAYGITWGSVNANTTTHHFASGDDQPGTGLTDMWVGTVYTVTGVSTVYWQHVNYP